MVSTRRARRVAVLAVAMGVLAPQPAYAHGAGGTSDALSIGLVVAAAIALWLFLDPRRRSRMSKRLRWGLGAAAAVLVVGAVTVPAWGPQGSPSKDRPETTARLAIVAPVAGAVTGRDVEVRLRLDGGTLVPQSSSIELVPDGGHIHTYLDGKLLSLVDGLYQEVKGLAPAPTTCGPSSSPPITARSRTASSRPSCSR
jgi:hypothetical protein